MVDLKPGYGEEAVTIHNLEDYIDRLVIVYLSTLLTHVLTTRTLDWVFVRWVRQQLDSLRQGFNKVFPLDKLRAFTPNEV